VDHVAWHKNAKPYSQTFNYMRGSESENKVMYCIQGAFVCYVTFCTHRLAI